VHLVEIAILGVLLRMGAPTKPLEPRFLYPLLTLFCTGAISLWAVPVVADEIEIPNVASANYRLPGQTAFERSTSNPTAVIATVNQVGLQLVKTGDRAAAEPGDIVIYRLLLTNTSDVAARDLEITDTLPLGFSLVSSSPRAAVIGAAGTTPLALTSVTTNGPVVSFRIPGELQPRQSLELIYAVVISPDAIRGTGRNLAVTQGNSNEGQVRSNPASHLVRVRPGILSDCGTIVGRVFVDKNFDGQQQPGEPGVPNAVIYMDDGNRITTDPNGLFSLSNVVAGYRAGTLDLNSLPGYTLAPNLYRIEDNSVSRFVKLAPGSTVKMNFAVTPTFQGGRK
jgi:uncharacterized repeat protein (TIGR01451 family)